MEGAPATLQGSISYFFKMQRVQITFEKTSEYALVQDEEYTTVGTYYFPQGQVFDSTGNFWFGVEGKPELNRPVKRMMVNQYAAFQGGRGVVISPIHEDTYQKFLANR